MKIKNKLEQIRPCEQNIELGDPICWIKPNGDFVRGPAYEILPNGVRTNGQDEEFFAKYSEIVVLKIDEKGKPDYLIGKDAQERIDNALYGPKLN